MAYLDKCPTVHYCCGSVGLRTAVLLIAVMGLSVGGFYLLAYTEAGASALCSLGAPRAVRRWPTRYVHGVLGVLVSTAHVLLLGAMGCRNLTLCELYVWSMLVVCLGVLAVNIFVVVSAFRVDLVKYGLVFLFVSLVALIWSLYSIVVVVNYAETLLAPM